MKNKGIYRLFRSKAEFDAHNAYYRTFGMQFTLDIVTMALGRMGYGQKRLHDIDQVIAKTWDDYIALFSEDLAFDKEMTYGFEKMEQELRKYLGTDYKPREERYKP